MLIKEFRHSRDCQYKNYPGPQPGYYYDKLDGFSVIKECECHKRWWQEIELNQKLQAAGLNGDYSFDDYHGEKSIDSFNALKEFTNHFDQYNYKKMLYLFGPNGTMKTSMAIACGKELIKKGFSVQYVLMNDLITNLIKDFNEENQALKEAFINRCSEVDLLIIDECFDKSKVTLYNSGFQIPFLDNFLRTRFEIKKKDILFISNKPPEQIEKEGFGMSIQSLVERNTKGSFLTFLDPWTINYNKIDPLALFREAIDGQK